MNIVAFIAFIILSANSFAQEELNTAVKINEEKTSTPKMVPVVMPMAPPTCPNELDKKQTEAILFLSSELDLLKERVRKIEKRLH